MEYQQLGDTELKVSKICLGTMTWGEQNTEIQGHEQLDYAFEQGVNFIDTAEMYSIPVNSETQGVTESIIGNWLSKKGNRDQLVIATKIVGPGYNHIRGGSKFNREHIIDAIGNSLKRLKTDVIDLYQLHWPERKANYFGKIDYQQDDNDPWEENFVEVLEVLNDLVKEGKIKHFGVSNETPWGLMRYLQLAKEHNYPRCLTIQNPYSLLNRSYEVGLSEISHREKVELLAYSPLAFGALSGKYLNGATPPKGRLTMFKQFSRFLNVRAREATEKYAMLAKKNNMSIAQMALAYVNSRPFVASNIIGATTMDQLKENIGSIEVKLDEELLSNINEIHKELPNPAP